MATTNYRKIAARTRSELLNMIYEAKTGHTGGSLSSVDILTALYYGVMTSTQEPKWPDRDRFVLSKGHSVEGTSVFWLIGIFPAENLRHSVVWFKIDRPPNPTRSGMEICRELLVMDYLVATGMALAQKKLQSYRTFVLWVTVSLQKVVFGKPQCRQLNTSSTI
jgi:transketolase